jgi:DNA-binding CsgD family transcriptional regulator
VATTDARGLRGLLPLLLVSVVVVLVVWGSSRGLWISNVHNGLLALTLSAVGAYVLFQRPGHREGTLFMAAGLVEGVLFLGRQIGHVPSSSSSPWWGWLGAWPVAVALALFTLAVICFPDGHLPSPRWRWVAGAVIALAVVCAAMSALWPVEYASTGVVTPHPVHSTTPEGVATLWATIAHPAYAGFQILWVVAVTVRWRTSDGQVRRQLAWLAAAAAVSVLALVLGLAIRSTPAPGLISATLLPVTAGWVIVHGQHVTAYSALTWLSRAGSESEHLPDALAEAVADALDASSATLWIGTTQDLHAVGVWPATGENIASTDLGSLRSSPEGQVQAVMSDGVVVGALSVSRLATHRLSLAEARLFDDLAAQATLVIQHLTLADVISRERRAGHLDVLTPRERDVLELMALGLSNGAIGQKLFLSVKTVEPIVSSIFTKLDLQADAASNRRVLAVLAFVRT